jgi:hypothetical protein
VKTFDEKPESFLRKGLVFLSRRKKIYLGGSLALLAALAILLQQKLGGNQAAAISNPLKLTSLNGLPANERWGLISTTISWMRWNFDREMYSGKFLWNRE